MYDAALAYARVIHRVEPEIALWVDPQPNEGQTCREMLREMDVVVPHRPQWLQSEGWFPTLFAALHQEGKALASRGLGRWSLTRLSVASGPVPRLPRNCRQSRGRGTEVRSAQGSQSELGPTAVGAHLSTRRRRPWRSPVPVPPRMAGIRPRFTLPAA